MKGFDRLTRDPRVMGGRVCIRGMRVTVTMVLGQLDAGRTADDILRDFPYLEPEDIAQVPSVAAFLNGYIPKQQLTAAIKKVAPFNGHGHKPPAI